MKLFDLDHPFFLPLWRRVAVVVACLIWAAVEWLTGAPFWGLIALGLAGYSGWMLLIAFDAEAAAKKQ